MSLSHERLIVLYIYLYLTLIVLKYIIFTTRNISAGQLSLAPTASRGRDSNISIVSLCSSESV